jgi:hypothetical protein
MNSRNRVGLAGMWLLTIGGTFAIGACSSSNNGNPTPGGGVEAGVADATTVADASTSIEAATGDDGGGAVADAGGGGMLDAAPDTSSTTTTTNDSGCDAATTSTCNPDAAQAIPGCTPCGTDPLYACPLATQNITFVQFTTPVPDASF